MIEAEVVPWHPAIPEPDECRARLATLCDSEREVLDLLALGYAPKQVALIRGAALKTCHNQLTTALRKLQVSGTLQALAVMLRAELEPDVSGHLRSLPVA